MPWKKMVTMSLRREFVKLASEEGANKATHRSRLAQFDCTKHPDG